MKKHSGFTLLQILSALALAVMLQMMAISLYLYINRELKENTAVAHELSIASSIRSLLASQVHLSGLAMCGKPITSNDESLKLLGTTTTLTLLAVQPDSYTANSNGHTVFTSQRIDTIRNNDHILLTDCEKSFIRKVQSNTGGQLILNEAIPLSGNIQISKLNRVTFFLKENKFLMQVNQQTGTIASGIQTFNFKYIIMRNNQLISTNRISNRDNVLAIFYKLVFENQKTSFPFEAYLSRVGLKH